MTPEPLNAPKITEVGKWQDITKCPLCYESDYIIPLIKNFQIDRPSMDWSVCENCGHTFANPMPTQKWLNGYYKKGYRQDTHQNEDWENIPARSIQEEVARTIRLLHLLRRSKPKAQKSLEIGSSSGSLMAGTQDLYGDDTKVFGVEPNDAYRKFSQEQFKKTPQGENAKVYANFSKVPKSPKFDLIIISHVLEHITDPRATLKRMHNILRKDGTLLLEIPSLFGGRINPMEFPHVHGFYGETISLMLELEGFTIITFETIGSIAPYWIAPQHMTITAVPRVENPTKANILKRYNLYREHLAFVKKEANRSAPTYEIG